MAGISDYRPIGVPDGAVELRVHGVSGTPPEALIKQPAILVAGTTTAGFYRQAPQATPASATSAGVREGYAWGGLTSGTRITSALRLLLLPFSLVNVAGWMVPGVWDDDHRAPTHHPHPESVAGRLAAHALFSRLLALCLTVFIAVGAQWIVLSALRYAPARFELAWLTDGKPQALATLGIVILLVGVWVWSARRKARVPTAGATTGEAAMDVATAPVVQATSNAFDVSRLWQVSDVTSRLSGIHAAVAIAGAVLVTDFALKGSAFWAQASVALAWLAVAAGLAGIGALALNGPASGRLSRAVRPVALPAALLSAVLAATSGRPTGSTTVVSEAEKAMVGAACVVAVAVLLLVLAQLAAGPAGGPRSGRLYAGAFTVIGFGTALTAIVGLAVLSTYWLTEGAKVAYNPVLGAMAQAIAIVGLVAVCVFLVVVLLQLNVATRKGGGVGRFERLRATVFHARGAIVAGGCVFAVGANLIIGAALWAAWRPKVDGHLAGPLGAMTSETGWAAFGWLVLAAVAGAVVAARAARRSVQVVVTLAIALGILALAWGAAAGYTAWIAHGGVGPVNDAFATSSDGWFVRVAILAACVTPALAVVAYIGWGSRDQGLRRGVGIIWDLVDFWPRQFHPWAPPPYTDTTIPELCDRVRALIRDNDGTTVVVSAHSQGAIIAVPALSRLAAHGGLTDAQRSRVSLLTYGQLLDSHYRWLFPWIFNPTLFEEVDASLGGRWINLFRTTDPLGQPVCSLGEGEGSRNVMIDANLVMPIGTTTPPKTLNHGDYWYSQPQFPNALFTLAIQDA